MELVANVWKTATRRARIGILATLVVTAICTAPSGSASTIATDPCPPSNGRLYCVTIDDTDGQSAGGTTYIRYKITVETKSGSTLTNGTTTVTLSDVVGTQPPLASTATYLPAASSPACAARQGSILCTIGNMSSGSPPVTFVLWFATPTRPNVTATEASVVTNFKENVHDRGVKDPNPEQDALVAVTSYEPDAEAGRSLVPASTTSPFTVTLGTTQADEQSARLTFTNPAGKNLPVPGDEDFAVEVTEFPVELLCPSTETCEGEGVHTDLSDAEIGTLSTTNRATLEITVAGPLPGKVKILHYRDGATTPITLSECGNTPPPSGECFTRTGKKVVTFTIQFVDNGDWIIV